MKNSYPVFKLRFILKLVIISFLLCSNVFAIANSKERTGKELIPRDGLPNFFVKAQRGDSVRVAYLGGSITAQSGWRVYSLEWMQNQYPKARFSEINAAIGGTGSNFGVFRLHEQVLRFQPDLLFVEFAVNDYKTAPGTITRAMEGIIRQTWEANPYTDICFVYTYIDDFLETETNGGLPISVQTMEMVANKYGVPGINFGFEVAKQVKEGKLIYADKENKVVNGIPVFCPDGVHPYVKTGHRIYNTVLSRSLEAMQENGKTRSTKHKLPKPINPGYFSNTKMLDFTEGKLSNNWEIIQTGEDERFKAFSGFLDHVGRACTTGESISFRIKGKAIGAYDIMGPDAGKVAIEIDGEVRDTISRFDRYCTYWRMNFVIVDKLEDKEHTVVFKTISTPFDKKSILSRKEDFEEHPEKYKENCWCIGKILLDGEVIK